jgi:hypothetical protein
MTDTWQIQIRGDIRVTVPADIHNFTTYVLLEQEDWCDPEIDFVRVLIESGMTVLDLDAGYGVYALTMAREMEGEGRVIALNANELFMHSVRENGLQELVATELAGDHALDFIRLGEAQPDTQLIRQGDPLVMFPAKEEYIQLFKERELEIYQHIPGLNALAPLEDDSELYGNLFACSPKRAATLRGLELMV